MWKTEEFIVANGFTQFNNPQVANDMSPFSYFDGEFGEAIDMEFSDAKGRRRAKSQKKKGVFQKIGQNIEKRRKDKLALKNKEIDAQKQIAEQSLKAGEQETKLLAQLGLGGQGNLPEISSQKTTSNTIYWVLGGLAVAGIIGFIVYKKIKKQ